MDRIVGKSRRVERYLDRNRELASPIADYLVKGNLVAITVYLAVLIDARDIRCLLIDDLDIV